MLDYMVEIRALDENNAVDVAELEKECFGADAWSENLIRNELNDENKRYILVYEDGKLAGYGGFNQVLDEGQINNVAVGKNYRRKGYGSLILTQFFELAPKLGINSFTLEVREGNTPARSLYEKHGFISAGTRKGYYRDGENACGGLMLSFTGFSE